MIMKNSVSVLLMVLCSVVFINCKKETPGVVAANQSSLLIATTGLVKGTAKDAQGNVLKGVKVTVEHTVWLGTYLYAETNNKGRYSISLPETPAGDWTAKAQYQKAAYGRRYLFDMAGDTASFAQTDSVKRNFVWKLSGKKPGANSYYGAHVDLYPFGTDVQMNKVKIIFTPTDSTLIDGSVAASFERYVQDVAGTYMVKDVPIGKYSITAKYPGKKLYLQNRHDGKNPALNKAVVFGKYGNLAETEYNIEFWLSE
jgi:hypothetical protein